MHSQSKPPVSSHQFQAASNLKSGLVKEIEFSGSTYQVLVLDAATGVILGCEAVGPEVSNLIAEVGLANGISHTTSRPRST